jgi:hypothetical protein
MGAKDKIAKALSGYLGAVEKNALGESLQIPKRAAPKAPVASEVTNALGKADYEGPSIRAYHGSPHDFDRFDMSKIGTGEGAQAYGHGLYFAEHEGVARSYRDQLSPNQYGASLPDVYFKGEKLDRAWPGWNGPEGIAASTMNDPLAGSTLAEKASALRTAGQDEAASWLDRNGHQLELRSPGRMYEVNISADPEHFLDWDKPLSQQSEAVKTALSNENIPSVRSMLGGMRGKSWGDESVHPYFNGADVLSDMRGSSEQAAAASALREAGIPGIKYLDQDSRGAGEGSRNYVVFDADLVSIVKKYGIPGAIGMGLISAEQGRQMQEQGL